MAGHGKYLPDAGLHPAAPKKSEQFFDEPQVLASDGGIFSALRRLPITRAEQSLGVIVFATAVGEGAANDWLALMLVDNRVRRQRWGHSRMRDSILRWQWAGLPEVA